MKLPIYLLIVAAACPFFACNSDDDTTVINDSVDYSNLIVNEFSLQKDDSILEYLDSVYFSIDLNDGRIYNADSLPKGTRINRLRVSISLPTVKEAELSYINEAGRDSIVNYLENPDDSIDFSNGDVKLRLKSYDEKQEFTYRISVNVHLMDPDSLYWNQTAARPIPTLLETPETSRAIEYKDGVIVVTAKGTDACVAYNAEPGSSEDWLMTATTLPQGADLHSLHSKADELFIVGERKLWKSSDRGETWSDLEITADYIYGACGDYLVCNRRDVGGRYVHFTYPSTTETYVSEDCPVRGTSLPLIFTNEWSSTPMMLISGGRTANGDLIGATWGYDNGEWAKVSANPMPAGEDIAFFPYFTFKNDTKNWTTTETAALFALNGGSIYISVDRGIHWTLGQTSLQLPSYIPKLSNVQALVFPTLLSDVQPNSSIWKELPSVKLSPWYYVIPSGFDYVFASRAERPITEWECPYIYLYGGYDTSGHLSMNIWRGVINRLSFKPLQ